MSVLPPKADIGTRSWNVHFVPKAHILHCGRDWHYSITSSASASTGAGISRPIVLAALRLITNRYRDGSSKGRSAGFAPAIPLMKSRRRIALPEAGTTPNRTRLQQGFATDEMGFRIKLHSSNSEPPMSALPPKADIAERDHHVRFVPIADIGLRMQDPLGARD